MGKTYKDRKTMAPGEQYVPGHKKPAGRSTTQRRGDAHRGHDRKQGRSLTNRMLPK